MFRKIRSKATYANVAATLALMLALGGTAYAAVARNSVFSRHIKNHEVKVPDLALNAVNGRSRFKNAATGAIATTDTTVGTLTGLAPGTYLIMSKVSLFQGAGTGLVRCKIVAGSQTDIGEGHLDGVAALQISNHLLVKFGSTGSATVSCFKESAGQTTGSNFARITAVRLTSQSTSSL